MENLDLTLLIVAMLLEDSNREQCIKVIECPDGDLRAHAQARLRVLDGIQNEARKVCYMESPPGMVESWDLRDWYIEKYGLGNLHHIDFQSISDGKKQEYYAYANEIVETKL